MLSRRRTSTSTLKKVEEKNPLTKNLVFKDENEVLQKSGDDRTPVELFRAEFRFWDARLVIFLNQF